MRTTRTMFLSALATIAALAASGAVAGELDPPAGPVAPTMKDLVDVEPRQIIRNDFINITPIVIDSPGSYYLGEDILAIFGQHGIEIAANDVTLDLNGFTIRGNAEVGSLDGIHISGDRVNIAIHNGTVRDFFGMGINGESETNTRIADVRAFNNGDNGIRVSTNSVVTGCSAWGNGGAGIVTGHNSAISDCNAYQNSEDGFSTGVGSVVTNGAAWENGEHGFTTGNGTTLMNCSSRGNTLHGFNTPQRCTLLNCAAIDNDMHGFNSVNACTYLNCSAAQNDMNGFEVDNALVRGCVANINGGMNYNATGGSTVLESHP